MEHSTLKSAPTVLRMKEPYESVFTNTNSLNVLNERDQRALYHDLTDVFACIGVDLKCKRWEERRGDLHRKDDR